MQAQRAAATTWRERRARINTISPGIIVTPLAYDEFFAEQSGKAERNANGAGYQAMIDASAARRVASSDEIADAAAFLLGEHATFINGTARGWTWSQLIDDGKAALAIDDEDDTRILSTDKKAVKAGGLMLALNGVAVKPTDDVDAEKEYELLAISGESSGGEVTPVRPE